MTDSISSNKYLDLYSIQNDNSTTEEFLSVFFPVTIDLHLYYKMSWAYAREIVFSQ